MNLILSFEDLCKQRIYNRKQHWYYVILLNPHDLSQAGYSILENFQLFHLDSGEDVDFLFPDLPTNLMVAFFQG